MSKKSYPCSLTDDEWALIEPLLNQGIYRSAGTKPKHSRRDMLDAIFYLLKTGCQWRELPNDFPPWSSVYSQFKRWKQRTFLPKLTNISVGLLEWPWAARRRPPEQLPILKV